MTRASTILGLGGLVLAAAAGVGWIWHAGLVAPSQAQQQAAPPPPSVIVATPERRPLVEYREFAGRFEASATVEIRARASGHLRSVEIADGDTVEAGQLLFTIDDRTYRAALDEARARLAGAEAQVELADLELRRAEQLMATNAGSRAALDQRRQQKKAADAARALASAAAARAEVDLTFTEIRAPIAGRVSSRRLDVGSLVGDGATLTTLVALDPIHFVFDVSERDLITYRKAAAEGGVPDFRAAPIPVETRGQGDDAWTRTGVVDFVDNRLEAGAGTIRLRARISNAGEPVLPGQFGRVRVPFSGTYDALLVPETALMTDQASRVLLTVAADGTVASTRVELGQLLDGGLRIVRSGIAADDRVIVGGQLRARPGQKVTAQAAAGGIEAAALGSARATGN